MYENFTSQAKNAMELANEKAHRFNHTYIGTEHILLGLAANAFSTASLVLDEFDITESTVVAEVEKLIKSDPDQITVGKLPLTPTAKEVIGSAIVEAREMNCTLIGTEHLLLGLFQAQASSVAAMVFEKLGLEYESVKVAIRKKAWLDEEVPSSNGEEIHLSEEEGNRRAYNLGLMHGYILAVKGREGLQDVLSKLAKPMGEPE